MMVRMKALLLLLPLALYSVAEAGRVEVFAAASLTDAFSEMEGAFEAKTGHDVRFSFAGSQALRTQIQQGARADVFASAGTRHQQTLQKAGLVGAGAPFARNSLAVVASSRSSAQNLQDLLRPGVKIVIAAETVPVGAATREMLGKMGPQISRPFLANVVSEEHNVRRVALKVGLGEADGGVVYSSDLTPALRGKLRKLPLGAAHNVNTPYFASVVKKSNNKAAAEDWIKFVTSAEGKVILRKWGFVAP